MYQTGDFVVYGTHGVCRILTIEERRIDRKTAAYYILEPIEQYMDSLDVNGMRECYERGMKCAYEHIDEILELIK